MKTNLIFTLALLFTSNLAFGHAAIMANASGQFVPREGTPTANKVGPCGIARSANVTNLRPGDQVTFTWVEQIKHPGHFIISFSQANDQGFTPFAGATMIPEVPARAAPALYSQTITIPNVNCTNCTIQLIQVMTETVPASNYYSCADITITASPPAPTPTPTPSPGGTPVCH